MRTIIIKLLSLVAFFAPTGATATTHEYVVTLAEDLRQIEVVARFGAAVADVSARSRSAGEFLISAHDCGRDSALPVVPRLVIPSDGIRCLAYRVDVEKAARLDTRYNQDNGNTLIVRIPLWMWRPRLGGADDVIVSFELPHGVDVSVPWQPLAGRDHSFRLTSSPQSGSAIAIFGEFSAETVRVADVDLRIVSVPSRANPIGPEHIRWTRETAEHITLAYGRFPNPHARVLLLPVANRNGESAIRFGRVVRDGGETIELMVDPSKPEESFLSDWTATHEFSHLMLPYINRDERWISEGFAQYYQNVLLARAGRYTEEHAWRKLRDGLERGRESSPALSPNQAAAGDERNSRMKIYWSGAALALMADVELRHRSGGEESLDLVLDRLQACCLPSRRTWSGRELFEKFDSLIDVPLFVDLYDRYADTQGFPDYEGLLERPELVEIRESLTARRYTAESGR